MRDRDVALASVKQDGTALEFLMAEIEDVVAEDDSQVKFDYVEISSVTKSNIRHNVDWH